MAEFIDRIFERVMRLRGEPTPEPSDETSTPTLAFVDQHVAQLHAVRADLTEIRAHLARAETRWASVKGRDDPEAHDARLAVGPRVLQLRKQMAQLTAEEQQLEAAIAQTGQRVVQYAKLAADTEQWLMPLVAALPSADLLTKVYALSRSLDLSAADLLQRTGDRQFRRSRVDAYRTLHDALTACVAQLERQRLLRSVTREQTGT